MIGIVCTGHGSAQRDVRNGIYSADLLGWEPFPGTLNLEVERGALGSCGEPDLIIPGPDHPHWLWEAVLRIHRGRRRRRRDVCVFLMHPNRWPPVDHAELVEVLAPIGLRDTFGLVDGDLVEVIR